MQLNVKFGSIPQGIQFMRAKMKQRWPPACRAGSLFVGFLFFLSVSLRAQSGPAKIFKVNCAECHGADGDANTTMGKSLKMRDLRSPDVQKRTDADLTDVITNGMAIHAPTQIQADQGRDPAGPLLGINLASFEGDEQLRLTESDQRPIPTEIAATYAA